MRIKDVRTRVFTKALDGKQRNPRFRWTEKNTLLIFVETEDGAWGVGEAWCDGGPPASLAQFIQDDVRPALLGRDADTIEQFWTEALGRALVSTRRSQTWAALSALDIALWDLKGKRAGQPIWRLMGGAGRAALPYASAGLYVEGQSAEAFGAEYAGHIAKGFRAVKIKVGGAPLDVDIARVAALRHAIGSAPRLMVDAVSAYTVPEAIAFARAARAFDLCWFEQPVDIADIEGQAKVHRDGGIPVAGNENEYGLDSFRRLIAADAVHFVQFDLSISGGFTFGRKLAAVAESHFRPITLHHSNSIVLMAANLQLAAAVPNCHSIEYHLFHQMLFERAPAGFLSLDDSGRIAPPEGPGLGIDLSDLAP